MKKILMRPHSLTGVLLCIFLLSGTFLQAQQYYNVMDYGANDGSQKITQAIAKAIEAAAATGGGTIYFPAGEYLTGPIHFKSNITLFIDAGATLKFSDNFDDYLPMVPSRWEGTDVINFSPLIYAYKVENIAIRGRGTIDGQGKKWWDFHHKLYDKDTPRTKWQEEFARLNKDVIMPDQPGMIEGGFLRPPFIQPVYSKNILIEGITITNSPFWTVNPEYCENVNYMEIDGVKTMSPHPETPVIALTNVENAFLHGSFPVPGTDVFLKLQGAQSKFVTLDGNNFLHVKTPVLKGEEVLESSVNGK